MCRAPLPAWPYRGHQPGGLVANILHRVLLWGTLPPSPTTHGQKLSSGQEEQCRGGEPGLLPSQNWGEGKGPLRTFLLAQPHKTLKWGLRTEAWGLISLALALGSLNMPSYPRTAVPQLPELLSLHAQHFAEGLHLGCTGSIRLRYCAHAARKLFIAVPISLVKLSGHAGISAHL